jgi:hypothetical protein
MKRMNPADATQAGAAPDRIRFRTTILTAGKTATGIQIPDEIVARLGAGKRPIGANLRFSCVGIRVCAAAHGGVV